MSDENEPKQDVKCPWCGRKKAVEQIDDRTFHCTHCQRMFEPGDD